METWLHKWGRAYDVDSRLTSVMGSPEGLEFIESFRRESNLHSHPEPEIIPFMFIFLVWPEEEWGKLATRQHKRDAQKLLGMAKRLSEMPPYTSDSKMVGTTTIAALKWLAGRIYSVQVGNLTFLGDPPSCDRDRGKRKVVFFLTGYFRSIGREKPPWHLITQFLKAAGLPTPKDIATWWSNEQGREKVTQGNPLEASQDSFIQWFQNEKQWVANT